MKMHPPGLLLFFLAACFAPTADCETPKLKSMKCNVKMTYTSSTACTSCAAVPRMSCPKGWMRATQGRGVRGCRYTVKLGENTLSQPGCYQICKKEIEEKKCCPGFWGTECYECPGGSENPCSSHGTCLDGIQRNGTCICKEQYSGFACQNCRDGNRFGPDCQSVCDCVHGECNSDVAGKTSCTCYGGYTGPRCDQEIPLCKSMRCEANSECVVKDGTAMCNCKLGYRKSGSVCVAQDPCTSSPCSPFAVCKFLGPRKYECTCKEGYQGDGRVCQPINPCVDNNGGCPENSTNCIYKGPGQASCVCKPGMIARPPSLECSSFASDCQTYFCDISSKCEINSHGNPSCVCKEGEIGDARSCYKDLMSEINKLSSPGMFSRKLSTARKMFASGCSVLLTKYGPFTVFLPSLLPINDKMEFNGTTAADLCRMHIVPGLHLIEDMAKAKTMWTLSGHRLTFSNQAYTKSFRYQDVPGELYNVLQPDFPAANGIIHVVDTLRKKRNADNIGNPQKTIGEILASTEIFSRFETILENCGLPAILDGPGPFTVFVPSNDGVDKLRDGRLIYLFTEGINKLQELVKHHIYASAAITVEKLIVMPHIVTMANQILSINISADGRILMDDSEIPLNLRNIVASNGIIHTVDGIFIPPSIIPIFPHRCNEEQHKIVTGSCVDCEAINSSVCPPGSREMELTPFPKECVYIHDPQGLNVLKRGCARYCNQTIVKPGCCEGFFGPDCTPCPGGYTNPCYGRGNCSDGIDGNGNCQCFEGFKGIACHICSNPNKHGENCDEDCGCVHGVCDNRPGSGGVCQSWSCKEGYTGKFCDRTSKNCGPSGLSQYCHQNAVCSLNDTARCICMDGYEGDGFSCQPIDLCSQPERGGCSPNALCTSTGPGNATCQCNVGWTGDGKACVAIDNCMQESRGNCHIHADCIYIGPGQSKCVCKRGYAGDGHNCDAINPCLMDNGGCHDLAICVPLGGGERSCACPEGYVGDGMTCYGDVLKELAGSSHFAGFYGWVKKSLFSIPAGTNVTVLVPSEEAIKSLNSSEKDFWLTPYMLPFLVRAHFLEGVFTDEKLKKYDRPELPTLNPRTRWQINTESGVFTIQNASLVVSNIPASNGIIHILSKVLLPPLGDVPPIPPGLQKQLDAVASFSTFKKLLEQYQLIGKIESSEKYTVFVPGNNSIEEYCRAANVTQLDNETVQFHIVLGEKLLPADLRSGVHKNSMLGLSYWLMFYQNSTQKFVNNIPLDGKLFETRNGILIGVSQVLQIQKNRCTANTTTIQKSRCGKCEKGIKCPPGSVLVEFPGSKNLPRCELRSGDTGCHFICAKVSLKSVCCPGYYGHMCEMCPGKPGQWCSGNGECLDGIEGSGECQCLEGFHGTACEMCEVGRYGADCKSECACDNGICNDGLQGDGSCDCFPGWKGPTCQERIEVDLCNGTCHQMANCLNASMDSPPMCFCSAGYTGNGTHCTEIDPCTIDHGGCSIHAVCTKVSPGERTCVCKEGYAGDGTLCREIDLCLESSGNCHTNAECVKTGPGKVACNCLPGYSGDGVRRCNPINLCEQNNGGCSPFGLCKYTGPGTRNCSCSWHSIGDGFTCRGKVYQELARIEDASVFFKMILAEKNKELSGAGPFTVFVPRADFIGNSTTFEEWKSRGLLQELLRYHMVGCQKLLLSDLEAQESLTSLSGHTIKITKKENSIYLNDEAKVVMSDIIGVNGVIHFINKILIPSDLVSRNISSQISQLNITEAAETFGYTIYSKLLKDAELLPLISNPLHRPFTMLWPTDAAFNALPEKRQQWLYHREHRGMLASYLKAHMIRDTKIVAGNMPQVKSVRTMHGSTVSFSCSRTHVGELLVGSGDAVIIQRHMEFHGGIAYGIDRLLEPPDLGSRCDEFISVELKGSMESCGPCGFEPPCPAGSVQRGGTWGCHYFENQLFRNTFLFRHNHPLRPSWSSSPWEPFRRHFSSRGPLKRGCRRNCISTQWVPQCCKNHYGRDCQACPGGLEAPCGNRGTCDDSISGSGRCNCSQAFIGTSCELCAPGRYGPQCRECNCTEHGVCNGGLHGDGFCFCAEGWTGERCEVRLAVKPTCSPPCHPQASCRAGNLCECDMHYEGDGRACTAIDMCSQDNGGCATHAACTQLGVNVSCTCAAGYWGDGYVCEPIDHCADGRNGDCSEHAHCISTGPNKRRCECKRGYIGDGIQCLEEAVPPTDRCLDSNGQCHREAICTDLHFHDKTMGVFHLQSPRKKYDFTYVQAQEACAAEGAALATFQQLAAAQQMGFHLCLVGWMDNGTAGYPTAFPTPSCGSNHVGIVDYGPRNNLSETWDAFCYREKDVTCVCPDGFVGDGTWCRGRLPDVLAEDARFSTFYSLLLAFANGSAEGLEFFTYLSDDSAPKTLFVPVNSGFAENETLSGEELQLHASALLLFSFDLTAGTAVPSRAGRDLRVSALPPGNGSARSETTGIDDSAVVEWDIAAANGVIHALAEPLRLPPPAAQLEQVGGGTRAAGAAAGHVRGAAKMAAGGLCARSSRELWTILLGRSALREPAQIASELNKHWQRLLEGLSYYKPPSTTSAEKIKADKDVAAPLKELGLRVSKFLGLDEEQSVQLLQCYLQEDYRGTRDSLKTVLQDERQSQALMLKLADYYYEERICILRCVLHLLTYFQDERHPYTAQYFQCVEKLDKELVPNYRKQFEELYKAEAPTWETHGNLMTERQVSRWFVQCLREQSMLLEVIFLYYAYFEMAPDELLAFAKLFKEQGFGTRQTNRHLVDESMDHLVDRIGYFSALILVEGMEIDSLHERALDDRTEEHKLANNSHIHQEMDNQLLQLGDVSHHAPVLLAWALLRHTINPEESANVIRRMGSTAIQLNVFQYLTKLLKSLSSGGKNCTASTACMCIYGLLSFVLTSLELHTLGNQQDIIDAACEVLAASSIPQLFWKTEPTAGLGIILDSVCGMFPHLLTPLLQLLQALVSDKSTAKKVYSFLDKMSFYIELYKHKPPDVISHEDGTLWRRQAPKLLYPLGLGQTNLRIPQGTVGQVMLDDRAYLVRWEYSYSSWTLFTCEIEMLLHVVSTADVIQHCQRVKPIIDLVHKVISTDVSVADCLLPITSRIYMLLQRLTTVISPPMDVIASCVNCLTVLAARMPAKVWTDLHHTGFLPFVANPVSSMNHMISAEGMNAGGYGNLLMSIEQPQGEYSVTISFLNLITTLVRGQLGSTQSQGLVPCIVFVLKEMLPNYHKWRYNSHGVREKIGCLILQLIHAILNLCPEMDPRSSNAPSLQSLCIFSLANTEAGQAVINIMGIGVDTIDMVMASQSSSDESQGQGQLLIQTVKLAFSVTNNVIRLKPPSSVVSPLEQALTQHGAHGNNLIAVLAKYIYHKHDPALPRLAIQLLKRLATVAPMSVYACLGSDAAAIRDAFLTRLQSKIEDMRIKVMILEFLTVAVETQPGLIELFLNLEVKDGSDGSKEFSLGEWSCLQVVLELIDSKQQERYWCPPLLHRAAIAFLHALWQDRRDSAMLVLRTKPKFWENLTNPLFGTLPPPSETSELSVLDTCALIMKIICLEIYYVVKGSLDQSLKDTLKNFSTKKRFAYWSEYVKSLAYYVAETEGSSCASMTEYQMLISAWRMLLIISTSHADIMHLTDPAVHQQLFLDVLNGTKALLLVPMSVSCLQLGSMLCTLLLILLKQWKSELGSVDKIINSLTQILEGVLQADQQMMEKTKAKVFSALITVLQMKEMKVNEIPQYSQLVLSVCETLQDEVIALFDQTRHSLTLGDATDDKDSMETDDASRVKHKDQRDGVCVLGLHLAKELCEVDDDGDYWLQITRKVPVLPTIFTALEISLRVKQNLHFTEASLHLLLTLARTQQGAAAVAGAGVSQSVCLPLLSVYQLSTNGAIQTSASSRKSQDAPSWPGVYRLSMSLMERLLKTLRYNFLTEALDFVGVHQERILQCLNAVRTVQSLACLEEADHTVGFILQLSNFTKEWHFHLPQLMRDMQVNLCYLCQACTSLLHSRKMLQHYLQTKNGDSLPSSVTPRVQRNPQASSKHPSPESEAAEQKALLMVQYSLLKILSKSLAALRHFTPDVCQILLDQSLDLAEYNVLFVLSFTTPAFDSDVAPSFGTLLATVNVALNMLGELDKKKEPFPQAAGLNMQEGTKTLKSLLMFTMENCFYLLISQAVRYLRDPAVHPRDKQRMKQELSSELSTLLSSLSRYFRRGGPSSPASGVLPSPQGKSASKLGPEGQEPLFQLVQAFVRHVQR